MSIEDQSQEKLVERAMSAFRWVAALRFVGQVISWVSTIFVIRFLSPEDYGVISLAEVFRVFLIFFSAMGLGQGLVKVDKLTPSLVQKTLGLIVLINIGLFTLQFFSAPYVAAFYNNEDLELVLQVLAFTYLFIPWTDVPQSLIARNLDHKLTSKVTFLSAILSSALSLTLAYMGFGYWALVAAVVFTMAFDCIGFNFLISYRRIPSFSLNGVGEIFRFGALIAVGDLIYVAYSKVDVAIAGKFFSVAEVGLYGVAIQLSTMLMSKSIPLFKTVAFPAFARMEAGSDDSNGYLVTTLRFATMLIFPVFIGVALVAEDLIGIVLGSKWTEISLVFSILVVSVPFRIVAYVMTPAVLAAGGARLDMVNSLITLVFLTGGIFLLLPMGFEGVALAWSLTSLCLFLLAVIRGGRLLNIPAGRLFGTLWPALPVTLLMCFVVLIVDTNFPDITGVLALYKIPLAAAVYALVFWTLFRTRSLELIRVTRRLLGK
ncbi:MAG: teichuronic acid exporter [Bacteroidia bacterium]|jgi:teichuronic acid exporter